MTLNNDFGSSVCHKPKRMHCHECKKYTQSIEPILILRYNKQILSILAKCEKCNEIINIALFDDIYKKFPFYYFDLNLFKFFHNKIRNNDSIKHYIVKNLFYFIKEQVERKDLFRYFY